jgi:hypothetical protein
MRFTRAMPVSIADRDAARRETAPDGVFLYNVRTSLGCGLTRANLQTPRQCVDQLFESVNSKRRVNFYLGAINELVSVANGTQFILQRPPRLSPALLESKRRGSLNECVDVIFSAMPIRDVSDDMLKANRNSNDRIIKIVPGQPLSRCR